MQVDLHGLNVDESMLVLDRHLANLGGLYHPGGILLQVRGHVMCPSHTLVLGRQEGFSRLADGRPLPVSNQDPSC